MSKDMIQDHSVRFIQEIITESIRGWASKSIDKEKGVCVEFISNFIWEKNARVQNEDALSYLHVSKCGKEYLLAVVCDGIGGLPEGENASSYVADAMKKELLHLLEQDKSMNMKKWRNAFLRRIYYLHRMIRMYGQERGICLGTTLSMVFLCDNKGFLFQIGDSAVFSGKHGLKRRTQIQCTKQGALKQAIGAGSEPRVEWKRLFVGKGEAILLCSDGFYRRTEAELTGKKRRLGRGDGMTPADAGIWLRNLYRLAVQRGERDNVTAICIICGRRKRIA